MIALSKTKGRVYPAELEIIHSVSLALDLPRSYANGIFHEENISLLENN